jgi:hypothetical protein
MTLPKLALHGLDTVQHGRRVAESINNILAFDYDESRRTQVAEAAAGLVPLNMSLLPGTVERYGGSKTEIIQALLNSDLPEIFCLAGATYNLSARITLTSNTRITTYGGGAKCVWDFAGVLGEGSGESLLVYGTGITGTAIENIHVLGDDTRFINNGHDTYGILIIGGTNCHVRNSKAEGVELGILMRDGCTDCSIVDAEGVDCFYVGVGSWAIAGTPNVRMKLHNLRGYSTQNDYNVAAISGIYIEETYDSDIANVTGHGTRIGVRIENSADNEISHVRGYNCWQSGVALYATAQRNNLTNVRAWDNNRANQDATDSTVRGNDNTFYSGLDISGASDNNNISNVMAYQTAGTEIPFNSGSDEPWLGSLIRGATSAATARVRRIALTSGSWGGGNAAGTLFCCEASGAFNASEVIQNSTTRVPYNSGGSEKPSPGDVLTGATSSANGTVLWVSQQSGGSTDWSTGDSTGYIYLTGVTGTFDVAENLNNTTTGTSNVATTNGASVAADTDIATTNGATTLGHENADGTFGRGFQKYGIGINVRNLDGAGAADANNCISNWQCFNNDLAPISDRGLYTKLLPGNDSVFSLVRNAP